MLDKATVSVQGPDVIYLNSVSLAWSLEAGNDAADVQSSAFTIRDLSAKFETGLNLITGPIASGKTMLLLGKL